MPFEIAAAIVNAFIVEPFWNPPYPPAYDFSTL